MFDMSISKHGEAAAFYPTGVASVDGGNDYQEDRALISQVKAEDGSTFDVLGMFDGHSGEKASHFSAKHFCKTLTKQKSFPSNLPNALQETFIRLNEKFLDKRDDSGCVCVTALLDIKQNKLTVANLGDSRLLVADTLGKILLQTKDHKPDDPIEKARIEKAGHEVINCPVLHLGQRFKISRVDGQIACSRSIGDADFKSFTAKPEEQALTCVPQIYEITLPQTCMIVLCCDGVWDVMTNEEVVSYVLDHNKQTQQNEKLSISQRLSQTAASLVKHCTADLGSRDNTSAVLCWVDHVRE